MTSSLHKSSYGNLHCPLCEKEVGSSHFVTGPRRCRLVTVGVGYECVCGKGNMTSNDVAAHLVQVDLAMHFAEARLIGAEQQPTYGMMMFLQPTPEQAVTDPLPPRPPLEISHDLVMCNVHGEPFRTKWPLGYLTFALTLFDEHMKDPEIATVCGGDPQKAAAMLEGRPLCCRFDAATLVRAYVDSGIGVSAVCQSCRKVAMGTPYLTAQRQYRHLCFGCVASVEMIHPGEKT